MYVEHICSKIQTYSGWDEEHGNVEVRNNLDPNLYKSLLTFRKTISSPSLRRYAY